MERKNVIGYSAYSESSYPALSQNEEFAYHYTIKKMAGEIVSTDTANPIMSAENERLKVFLHALLFVGGFALVFIVGWGGSVTLVGQFFGAYKRIIAQIGGVVVIAFGLATLGVIRLPWFYADTRAEFTGQRGTFGGSALMGIFFAAGWSPCIGATLGAILTMGLSQQTVGQAMWLASGYSLGLGIPFLALALGLERATGWIKRVSRYRRVIQIASGIFIITIGILLFTNTMSLIAIWAFKNGLYVEKFALFAAAPTYFTAILAGLLSFLSPCVLPLVPAYLGYLSGHTFQKA
jgi:cytochrome c-type biogenesis protein